MRQTCTTKVKQNAVKQEYEKQDELKRSALRALAALSNIPKAGEWLLHFTAILHTSGKRSSSNF